MKKNVGRTESDEAAGFEQGDARGQEQGFVDVVGNEDDSFAETASQSAEFALKFGASDGIQRAERFVHEKDGRVSGKGAGDADALALSAGKFSRGPLCEFAGIETDQAHHFFNTREPFGGRPVFKFGNQRDVFCDGEMGEKTCFLNDITDAAAETNGIPFGGGATVDEHSSRNWKQETIYELQQRGLSAPAAAEKDESFTGLNGKRDVRDEGAGGGAIGRGSVTGDIPKFDNWFAGSWRFRIHFD